MIFEVIPNEQTPRVPDIQMNKNNLEKMINLRERLVAFKAYAESRNDAAGLAANQVSIDGERFMSRVFALRDRHDHSVRLIIEPQIVEYIGIKELKSEGCLTWKGKVVIAERSRAVKVSYYNWDGEHITNEIYKGFDAQVWQHEINHLNGVPEQIEEIGYPVPKPIEVGRNDQCPCGQKDIKLDVFALHELYDSGKTMQELEMLFGIGRKVIGRLFKKHNLHIRTKSENATGELNSQFDGEPKYTKNGYVEIWNDGERILEHRYVVEESLKRKLTNEEVVHHKNGIKDDNDINNLEVSTQSEHMKKHKLPLGQWSRNYEFCIKCGTTERKHAGNGYCTKCNMHLRDDEKRGYESEYDEDGKRIFSEDHRQNLKDAAILREKIKKYKDCCLI